MALKCLIKLEYMTQRLSVHIVILPAAHSLLFFGQLTCKALYCPAWSALTITYILHLSIVLVDLYTIGFIQLRMQDVTLLEYCSMQFNTLVLADLHVLLTTDITSPLTHMYSMASKRISTSHHTYCIYTGRDRRLLVAIQSVPRVSNRKYESMQNQSTAVFPSRSTIGKIETIPQMGRPSKCLRQTRY